MASKLRAWAIAVRAPARMTALLRPQPEPVLHELSIAPDGARSPADFEMARRLTRQSRNSLIATAARASS